MRGLLSALFAALIALTAQDAARADGMPSKYSYAPAFSWTGLYVGANVGYGWSRQEWVDPLDHSDDVSYSGRGFMGGGQLGYNLQSGPWVWGVEVDASRTGIKGRGVPLAEPEPTTLKTEADWIVTLTGRLGYSHDQWLYYVRGGAAWARLHQSLTELDISGATLSTDLRDTRTGWIIGGGVEYALRDNWSARLSYDYLDFGTKAVTLLPLANDPANVDVSMHQVKFSLNYRFGGPSRAEPLK